MSRKSHSSETKSVVIGRHFLSFVLFLVIVALSLTVFVRVDCVDGKNMRRFSQTKNMFSHFMAMSSSMHMICVRKTASRPTALTR